MSPLARTLLISFLVAGCAKPAVKSGGASGADGAITSYDEYKQRMDAFVDQTVAASSSGDCAQQDAKGQALMTAPEFAAIDAYAKAHPTDAERYRTEQSAKLDALGSSIEKSKTACQAWQAQHAKPRVAPATAEHVDSSDAYKRRWNEFLAYFDSAMSVDASCTEIDVSTTRLLASPDFTELAAWDKSHPNDRTEYAHANANWLRSVASRVDETATRCKGSQHVGANLSALVAARATP
jgi:hypothetical protein